MSLLGLPFFSRPQPRRLRWLRVITGFAWCCGGTRSLRAGSGPSPREPPAAAAEARLAVGPVSASDMGALERQLGYRPYPLAVGARCVHGHPQAFVWDPLARFHGGRARRAPLDSGLFRLSCPLLVQAVDRWEAEGAVRQLQAEVDEGRVSECSRADLEEANRRHALARRALVGSRLEEALQRSREADAAAPPPPPPRRKRTGAGAKSGARPPRALSREELSEQVLNSGVAGQSPSKPEVKCLHAQLADHLCRDHSNPLGEAILSGVAARGVAVHGDSQCHQQCDCGVAREAATWWYTPVKNKQKLFTRLERRKQRQVARLEAAEEEGGGAFSSLSLAAAIRVPHVNMGLFDALTSKAPRYGPPVVIGEESLMSQKAHGTSEVPVQKDLRWNCGADLADRICNFNRHYAENAGYWERSTTFLKEEEANTEEITFFDSNSGDPLFYGPRGRTWQSFVKESRSHGWPSFRDAEVNWDYVRVLPDGECVSTAGTHLGHNLPDGTGNRYCINLVSVAGRPADGPVERHIGPKA